MSLDVWFQQDIKRTLLAIHQSHRDTARAVSAFTGESSETVAYRAGFNDALRAVAIAHGIVKPTAMGQTWEQLTRGNERA